MSIKTKSYFREEKIGPYEAINGIIKQYYTNSGTAVNPNTFVEFINNTSPATEKFIKGSNFHYNSVNSVPTLLAEKLNNNQVLVCIASLVGGYDTTTEGFYVFCFTFNGTSVTYRSYYTYDIGATAGDETMTLSVINSTQAVITCTWMDQSYATHSAARVITVSSSGSISGGTLLSLDQSEFIYSLKISSNRVAVVGRSYYDGTNTNYGVLYLSVSGTTLSVVGTSTQSIDLGVIRYYGNPLILSNNRKLITTTNNKNAYGQIVSVSGSYISFGTKTLIATMTGDPCNPNSIKIDNNDNKILCGCHDFNNLYAWVLTLSGNVITTHTLNTLVSGTSYQIMAQCGIALSSVGNLGIAQYVINDPNSYTAGPYLNYLTFNIDSNNNIINKSGITRLETISHSGSTDVTGSLGSIQIGDLFLNIHQIGFNTGETVGDGRWRMYYNITNTGKINNAITPSTTKIDGITLSSGSNTSPANVLILA